MLAVVPDAFGGVDAGRHGWFRVARGRAPAAPAPGTGTPPTAPVPDAADLTVSGGLRPGASLGAEQREGSGSAARETFDYLVTVTNHGPSTARQVRVTDQLPVSLEFVSSPDGCAAEGRTVVCGPLAALAVGRTHSWVITVRLSAGYLGDGADIVNEAVVGSDTADPDAANNSASLTGLEIPPTVKDPTADLEVGKTTP
ncbi:DUF11 domain-containing protein [Streptomyces sp. NPDC048424]|uniref:DUF11 domain-containing protein n=1 Tax=Streptomyces sp. NPDC048424 TaxID=3155265 RepID=UPI00343C8661